MTEYHDCGHGRHVGAYCEDCAKEVFTVGRVNFENAYEALADGVEKANEIGKSLAQVGKKYAENWGEVFDGVEMAPTGLHAEYYDLPDNVRSAQDLIEYLQLDFANGNILKSLIREHGTQTKATDALYEAEKRYYFAKRHLQRVQREQEVRRRLPNDGEEGQQ